MIMRFASGKRGMSQIGISRVAVVVIIIVIIVIGGGAAYYVSTLSSSSSTSSTSTSSTHATTTSSSSSSSASSSSSSSSSSVPATSSSSTTSQAPVKVTLAFPAPVITESYAAVAQSLGIFAKYGLVVNMTQLHSNTMPAALGSGSITFALMDGETPISADASGANLVILASDKQTLLYSLIVNPSITSPQDLIGKSVASAAANGSPDIALTYILNAMGVNRSQVKISYIASDNTRYSAFAGGAVDAAVLQPPFSVLALEQGFKQLGQTAPDTGFRILTTLTTTKSYLANNPTVVENMMKALLEATHDMYTNSSGVIPALTAFTGLNASIVEPSLQQVLPTINPTWIPDNATIQTTFNAALSANPAVASLKVSDVINTTLITSLLPFTNSLWGGSPPPYKYG